jgi:hypothetical protein
MNPIDAREQDAYWSRSYWLESYYRLEFDYEDYAPAFCVGYIGKAQYGGEFEDARNSLCANWIRIRGDSRLELDEALLAIRAAWDRAGRAEADWEMPSVSEMAASSAWDPAVAA